MIMTLIRSVTISSVDIFVIITGYFLCSTQNRSLGKPLSLLFQVSLYSLIVFFAISLSRFSNFSVRSLLGALVPNNWFITLYVVLYIISPYLNAVFRNLSTTKWFYYLGIVLVSFSLWPTFLGVASHFGVDLSGLSTYGRGGNNAGYTFINFVVLYSIGAFIKMNEIEKKIKTKYVIVCIFLCVLALWGMRYISLNTEPWHIAGWYDNLLVILLAASIFLAFKRLHFSIKIVNHLATAAFSCYIIHPRLIALTDPNIVLMLPLPESIGFISLFIILTYLLSWGLYNIYKYCFSKIFKRLDNIKFHLI